MFAHDRGWVRRLDEAVRNGLTAEAAVEKVQSDMRARMMHMTDPYMRDRMNDFDDLGNRLLRQLMGHGPENLAATLPRDAIVVSRSMGAADLLDYPRDKLRGLVLEDAAATSHVVIVARAIGIPVGLFTAVFALARTVGWIAQLNEMIADPEYKIGRPRQLFVGATPRNVQPIDQRPAR